MVFFINEKEQSVGVNCLKFKLKKTFANFVGNFSCRPVISNMFS